VPNRQVLKFRRARAQWPRRAWRTPRAWAKSRPTATSVFAANCYVTPGSAGGITTIATA